MIPPSPQQPPEPKRVVLCCAKRDVRFRKELETHLAPFVASDRLHVWHADRVAPGSHVERDTLTELSKAGVVVALVSAELLEDHEILAQIEQAAGCGATIIPVLVRACLWQQKPLNAWPAVPATGEFISGLKNRDTVWARIVQELLGKVLDKEVASSILRETPVEQRSPRERWLHAMVDAAIERPMLAGTGSGLGVKLDDVRVPARVALDREGKSLLPPLVDQLAQASSGSRFVLLGDVGTGKSELLHETCGRLAERALLDPAAPIPVLVAARDLKNGLERAVLDRWRTYKDVVPAVLSKRSQVILLIDGLDEAGREAPEQIRKEGKGCHATVVASRPVLSYRDLGAQERWLVRWSEDESYRFLERCAEHLPQAAERLHVARPHVSRDLLEKPLTASMCLLVAEREREALHSRAEVYCAVIRGLVDDWSRPRKIPDTRVKKVMSALEKLALDVVRGLPSISESRLARALGRHFLHRESTGIETAEAHLGLLVRRGTGAFDFALRSLAEHLAGRALLQAGDAEIVAASKTAWGAEPVRHAIGLSAIEGFGGSPPRRGHASSLIDAILRRQERDDIGTTNRNLRSVLVAVRAACDLTKMRPSTRDRLVDAVVRRLRDERSIWVGDRVAEVVAEWVRARPVRTKGLVDVAVSAITEPATRASWLAAQTREDAKFWRAWLIDRDPAVRWVATQRLAPFVERPVVQRLLLFALQDDGMVPGVQPVAMGAGMILRRAARGAQFRAYIPYLRELLERGDAFQQAGAAIALLPGEADPKRRAYGLCRALGGNGFGVPQAILQEVAADPVGRAELDRLYSDWPSKAEPRSIEPLASGWQGNPPCSSEVRQRLVRAIAPALRRASAKRLQQIQASAHMTLPAVACELADDFPEIICALLDAAPEPWVPLYGEPDLEKLSRAAVRHEAVRESLLGLWRRLGEATAERRAHWKADYPGRALDGLVRKGDAEAQQVFAEWVIVGHHAIPFRPFDAVLLDGFDCPPLVRDTGHSVAVTYFGDVGKVVLSTLAGGLFRLSSFWKHDIEMRRGVEAWLATGAMGELRCGLWALQRVGLTEEARRDLRKHVIALFAASEQPFFRHDLWQLLPQIDAMGLLGDLRELVEALVKDESLAMIAVPLTMPWHDAREQRARSKRVCKSFSLLDSVPPYLAVRLVEAAPDVWAAMLEAASVGASSIEPVLPFLRGLPAPLQARVGRRWLESASEFPWVRDGMSPFCIRPADKVREILFDLGIEEPPPPEIR